MMADDAEAQRLYRNYKGDASAHLTERIVSGILRERRQENRVQEDPRAE